MRVLLSGIALLLSNSLQAQLPVNRPHAPNIILPSLNGDTVELALLKGKIVLVDFWASWCTPCRQSNRGLVMLYNKYHDLGFEILGVSMDSSPAQWHQAIAADKMPWIHVNQPKAWQSDLVKAWRVWKLPSSFLLDREGASITTNLSYGVLDRWLEDLLKTPITTK